MNLFIPTILKYLPDWNKKAHTEADALNFCKDHKIILMESENIDDLGEYRIYEDRPFIILHKYISRDYRPWVLWHEIGHFILHPTTIASFSDKQTKRRAEKEAHFVAALALMPKYLVDSKTINELHYEYGHPKKLILYRKEFSDLLRK